jgi:transcriptional regulator with XRE-family HTH domain
MTESERPTDMHELAQLVKAARKRKGWTQKDLADAAGIYFGTVSNFELGKTEPQPHHMRAMLHALDLEGEAGDDVAAESRSEWDPDVKTFLDMMGLFLMALPEDDRREVMFSVTRQIVNR